MAIVGIVAVDRQGAIGKAGALPWHYSADLKFFKEQTINNACVMGARTWATLKRPLKERLNIVLSRSAQVKTESSVLLLRDVESVLALKKYLACDLFIIGGAQVYSSFLAHIERWIVTEVPLTVEGADTFMPENFLQDFRARTTLNLEENLKVRFYERVVGAADQDS